MTSRPSAGTGGLPTPADSRFSGRWVFERSAGSPRTFHDRQWPDPPVPTVWVNRAATPALVLGSTQRPAVVNQRRAAEAGIEVVRRRSGGGAVLVVPGDVVWIDVFLPAADRLWCDDVGRAFGWLGQVWWRALCRLGFEAKLHAGPSVRGPWSDLVCFAGLGPGEATVDGRKVVGMSQRRNRQGARFECAALVRWNPAALLSLLDISATESRRGHAELADVAAGLEVDQGRLEDAFVVELARV